MLNTSILIPMFSIWEKQSFLTTDVLILGAGITGLSTAASLKEANPSLKVTVLEKGVLPSGASTKNAGFACFGSVSELLNDINTLGEEGMISLVEKRIKGLEKTKNRLGEEKIDLKVKGGYELLFEDHESLNQIDRINSLLKHFYDEPVYNLSDEKISFFGLASTQHLIENRYEGQLDTGKLMSALWDHCMHLGIKVHTGCDVTSLEEIETGVIANCPGAAFSAQKMGVCTNAFAKKLVKENLDLVPGRGIVMSIQPEKELKINGTFHFDQGYYYFRDYYGKLLFGGGRNLDLKAERTTEFGINEMIKGKLIKDLDEIILPNQSYRIQDTWSGIMAFGKDKTPIVRKVSERIALGVRLGGMGVAIGSLVGDDLAQLLLN